MPSVTVLSGQTSAPLGISAGSIVTALPASGASAVVEYTTASLPAVLGGNATWLAWPKGTATGVVQAVANKPGFVRVNASGGAATLDVDVSPASGNQAPFRPDWFRQGENITIAQSAVAASVTGTLTETVLATIPIPAGAMGVNGCLRIPTAWTCTDAANTKTLRVRLNGILIGTLATTGNLYAQSVVEIFNRGAMNNQYTYGSMSTPYGTGGNAPVATAVDMSAAQTLTITAQLANVGSAATLEAYRVEILNP